MDLPAPFPGPASRWESCLKPMPDRLQNFFTINIRRTIGVILLIFAGLLSLQAQPVNVQQFQNTQQAQQMQTSLSGLKNATNAPELYPAENTDVGPQHIL